MRWITSGAVGMVFDGLAVQGELRGIFDRAGLLCKWSCRRCNPIEQESGGHFLIYLVRIVVLEDGLYVKQFVW
jgi:hypothetical protein